MSPILNKKHQTVAAMFLSISYTLKKHIKHFFIDPIPQSDDRSDVSIQPIKIKTSLISTPLNDLITSSVYFILIIFLILPFIE